MTGTWHAAAAEFAASVAALNANALHRAGLLDGSEIISMHRLLALLEKSAQSDAQKKIAREILKLLPPLPISH